MAGKNKVEMKNIIKEAIKELLSDDDFIAKVAEKVTEEVNKKLQEIENRTSVLESENYNLKNRIMEIEQYSRRNNIRIFGIPEEKGKKEKENLVEKMVIFFKDKLNVELQTSDIETCHRVGESKDGKKPIFITFAGHLKKTEVIRKRKSLKGTHIFIVDDLTKEKITLFKNAAQKLGKSNVWTSNGNVMVKIDNNISVLRNERDLEGMNIIL